MLAWPGRLLLMLSGIVLALPGSELIGYTHLELLMTAALVGGAGLVLAWLGRARDVAVPTPAEQTT